MMAKEQEPVAWLAHSDEFQMVSLFREHAEAGAAENEAAVVPLYRAPALTDAEREAIEASREFWQVESDCSLGNELDDEINSRYAATLGALLERTK